MSPWPKSYWKELFRTKSPESMITELAHSNDHPSCFVHTPSTVNLGENLNSELENQKLNRKLKKTLGVTDLTAMGIAAVLGAGVFSTIGNAAADGGPAVVFLFIFAAIACTFSALCYAEFASAVPVSGSAYTYAYATFGELVAWIIGWDLLIEYAIGNIAVAISWSQYFVSLLESYGIQIPRYLTLDFFSASRGYDQIQTLLQQGRSLTELNSQGTYHALIRGYHAWIEAPRVFSLPVICDLPTLLITGLITWIVYIGIEESKRTSNLLVIAKLAVVLVVIGVGATYVRPEHWIPFAPNGVGGVMKGVSAVFFAYIGFDAVSTTAEECKDPQRDLPRGMIYSLIICTTLYSLTALVLTGIVSYKQLAVGDPLAYVFGPEGANLPWLAGIVNISAVIALATVLLVFQIGQPRIWMAMSRDGLLPPIFSAIHPKYRTPWFSTLVTGAVVAIPSLFVNLTEVTDLTSIGTLFAFILVCGGVLRLQSQQKAQQNTHQAKRQVAPKFTTPYIDSRWIFPALMIAITAGVFILNPEGVRSYFSLTAPDLPNAGIPTGILEILLPKLPMAVFAVAMVILSALCFLYRFSLIPVLGLASCSYLMTELGITNWIRFGVWLIAGSLIYFFYGRKHSRLANPPSGSSIDI